MTTDVTEIDQLEIEVFGFSEPDPDDGNDHLAPSSTRQATRIFGKLV